MTCGTKDGKPHLHTPLKAMRLKCLDCCYGSSKEVELCVATTCSLYPYRFGKSPSRKSRVLSEEEKEVLRVRLAKSRKKAAENTGMKIEED